MKVLMEAKFNKMRPFLTFQPLYFSGSISGSGQGEAEYKGCEKRWTGGGSVEGKIKGNAGLDLVWSDRLSVEGSASGAVVVKMQPAPIGGRLDFSLQTKVGLSVKFQAKATQQWTVSESLEGEWTTDPWIFLSL